MAKRATKPEVNESAESVESIESSESTESVNSETPTTDSAEAAAVPQSTEAPVGGGGFGSSGNEVKVPSMIDRIAALEAAVFKKS